MNGYVYDVDWSQTKMLIGLIGSHRIKLTQYATQFSQSINLEKPNTPVLLLHSLSNHRADNFFFFRNVK